MVSLVFGALIGVPVSAAAFGFMELISALQQALYDHLPNGLGFNGAPVWWSIPLLVVGGVVVAAAIRWLPGTGGHIPALGFTPGMTQPIALPGVVVAAVATLASGAVLGPEAPLIALGSGLAVLAVKVAKPGTPAMGVMVAGAAGSFAAIATLLGSPLLGAIFMLEAIGLGGVMMSAVLLPGLLAAGVGSLVFIGLGTWTGLGTFSLSIPDLPYVARPTAAEFGWAVLIGLVGALVVLAIRRGGLWTMKLVNPRLFVAIPVVGLAVGGLAVAFAEATGKAPTSVLFSGQDLIGPLLDHAATWSAGALVLLLLFKGVAYSISLGSFRGGPIFPALLLGAAGGVAASHLPGLGLVPAAGMGMGAACAAMLRLPVVSVALPTILLFHDGLAIAPVVIVAVVVAYVATNWLDPKPAPAAPSAAATGATA